MVGKVVRFESFAIPLVFKPKHISVPRFHENISKIRTSRLNREENKTDGRPDDLTVTF